MNGQYLQRDAMKMIQLVYLIAVAVVPAAAGERIAFSPDGKRMAVGWDDGRIELRDGATGDLRASFLHEGVPDFDGVKSAVNWTPQFAFSPDGKILASACGYAPVILWDAITGKRIRALPGRSVGYDLTFSSDASRIIGIGVDSKAGPRRLTLWDAKSGRRLRDLTVDMKLVEWNRWRFKTAQFAHSGPVLIIETYEGEQHFIRVWNAQTGEETMKIASEAGYPPSWVLSPDGKILVTRSYSSPTKHTMWDTVTGKAKKTWERNMDVNNK